MANRHSPPRPSNLVRTQTGSINGVRRYMSVVARRARLVTDLERRVPIPRIAVRVHRSLVARCSQLSSRWLAGRPLYFRPFPALQTLYRSPLPAVPLGLVCGRHATQVPEKVLVPAGSGRTRYRGQLAVSTRRLVRLRPSQHRGFLQ